MKMVAYLYTAKLHSNFTLEDREDQGGLNFADDFARISSEKLQNVCRTSSHHVFGKNSDGKSPQSSENFKTW